MPSNFSKFMQDTQKAIDKELEKQKSEAKKIVLGAYSAIVNGSAVDTGLFRTSHVITYNRKDSEELTKVDESRIEKSKAEVIDAKFNNGDTLTVQTNSSYAPALEEGHSKQQPAGLYGRTREKTRKILNKRTKI